jgi:hypothetical protein
MFEVRNLQTMWAEAEEEAGLSCKTISDYTGPSCDQYATTPSGITCVVNTYTCGEGKYPADRGEAAVFSADPWEIPAVSVQR